MSAAPLALAKFVEALTAVDQIPKAERSRLTSYQQQSYRRARAQNRYRAWLNAEAAYHRAYSLSWACLAARQGHGGDKQEAEVQARGSAVALLIAVEAFMAVPIESTGDRKERSVLIRKWGKAMNQSGMSPKWHAAAARWLAQIGGAA